MSTWCCNQTSGRFSLGSLKMLKIEVGARGQSAASLWLVWKQGKGSHSVFSMQNIFWSCVYPACQCFGSFSDKLSIVNWLWNTHQSLLLFKVREHNPMPRQVKCIDKTIMCLSFWGRRPYERLREPKWKLAVIWLLGQGRQSTTDAPPLSCLRAVDGQISIWRSPAQEMSSGQRCQLSDKKFQMRSAWLMASRYLCKGGIIDIKNEAFIHPSQLWFL